MIPSLPPGVLMMFGAILLPLLGKKFSAIGALVLSSISLILFWTLPADHVIPMSFFGQELILARIDKLSWIFCLVFHLAAIMASVYALHVKDTKQHVAAMLYAGSSIMASCAGDMITLFVCWELTAVSSVFLIWASNSEKAYRSGMRYLIIQVISGVLLLSGAIIRFRSTGDLGFHSFIDGDPSSFFTLSLGSKLILIAFGIKAAFPLLHNWLQDAYPKSTPTGTVFLSAFTTKLAIYSLARGFAGLEELVWIGCAMTLFPIVFAVIENDLRRVLAYSLNNQLGFMVVGIGIGSDLAINGTAAHAFCHIIYKALLFMSMGAVLKQVGTTKATELGGLHKTMPWTTLFCIIGAGAISGFPLLSGFISKSMIISAAAYEHRFVVWFILLIASAGVMEHSGIKIPFFAFFAHDSGKRPKEAPLNMLIAMGMGAFSCVGLGVAYPLLYKILPYELHHEYVPYTLAHVVMQLQLLLFAGLAFLFLMKMGLYPEEKRSTNLDFDWVYRKLLPDAISQIGRGIRWMDQTVRACVLWLLTWFVRICEKNFNETGNLGTTWSTSLMAFWAAILLGLCLMLYYL
ncbi:MAG: Na(+)/H(+) antiporter subunit D [Planctomycetota bacterium]